MKFVRIPLSLFDSSISEKWQVRHVFEDVLKLCDDGVLEMTIESFSRRTNIPRDVVEDAFKSLCLPDPKNGNQTNDGRRMIELKGGSGWTIVGWDKYAEECRNDRVREQTLLRVRKYREGTTTTLIPETPEEKSKREELQRQAEEIYSHYPRRVSKKISCEKIVRALKKYPFEKILEATKKFAEIRSGQDQQFTPHPATWYFQERFNDDPSTWTNQKSVQKDKPLHEKFTV